MFYKKFHKKGFTLVELVVVIAVIAILAAVLIPMFVNVNKRAKLSADQQAVYEMNLALSIAEAEGDEEITVTKAKRILIDAGYDIEYYQPLSSGYSIYWLSTDNVVILVNSEGSVVYPEEFVSVEKSDAWVSLRASQGLEIDENGVLTSGASCFNEEEVVIPLSVKSIAEEAFYGQDDNYNTISSNIRKVVIPESVETIDSRAFAFLESLESVTMEEGTKTIGSSAFANCTALTEITLPDSITTIGAAAFRGCSSLEQINIPSSVTTIKQYTFADTGIKNLTIPQGVTIGTEAFKGCSSLESVVIGSGVKIGNRAFGENSRLTSVTFEGAVTLGNSAFVGCTALESVVLPEGVTKIEQGAFGDCPNLTEITIPSTVTEIGKWVFLNCTTDLNIRFGGTQAQWDAIVKDSDWNSQVSSYTVYDVNGNEIASSGS